MSPYEAVASFVETLVAGGVRDVVVSPGLRSAPLSLTAHATPELRITVVHDERVAGFVGLGLGKASGVPALVICTSGTAVANLLPAVVEAHHARVPLIVATGDRPPELHGWDSPQTIEQTGLFGTFAVALDLAVADELSSEDARAAASAALVSSGGTAPGPVHVNWPFREPLEPTSRLEPSTTLYTPAEKRSPGGHVDADVVALIARTRRGVIAAGELRDEERAATLTIAEMTGWPVLADPLSGLRTPSRSRSVVVTSDHLLLDRNWADGHIPDFVLRVGSPPTSKSLRTWMERCRPKSVVVVDPAGRRRDPSRTMTELVTAEVEVLADALGVIDPPAPSAWFLEWVGADASARDVIARVADDAFEEAAATRTIAGAIEPGVRWHVASSTPIRDVDWYVDSTHGHISSNRGANGIDGTIATATGLGLGSDRHVIVTLGDVAAVHDAGGLLAAARTENPPTVVVLANGGGGIFSLLPIADAADPAAFEAVLHTPVHVDFASLATAAGYSYIRVDDAASLRNGLATGTAGPPLFIEVPVTVAGSRRQLDAVRREIAAAL